MSSFKAEYFDGDNATSHEVLVFPEGNSIVIQKQENMYEKVRWPFHEIRVEHFSGGRARLLWEKASLLIEANEVEKVAQTFPALILKGRFEREKIPHYLLGVLLALIIGYFSMQLGSRYIANFISPEQERWIFSTIIETVKKLDCSNSEQRDQLWKIIRELDGEKYIEEVIIIREGSPNAFAYPGGLVAFTTGFFEFVKDEKEVLGVMAHELQHIKLRHHIRGFMKSGFISLIFNGIAGGMDSSFVDLAETLVSSRYHVEDERQADIEAAKLLQEKNLSVVGLSSFFERLSKKEGSMLKELASFISTHPSDEKRIAYLKPFQRSKFVHKPILSEREWDNLKKGCHSKGGG